MLLTLCGSCYKGVELGSHLSWERSQDLQSPLMKLKSLGVSVQRKGDMRETKNLLTAIQELGPLRLETLLSRGRKVSVSFWLSKGKLQSSYLILLNSGQQDNASVGMGGSAQGMPQSQKHTQLSFKF